MYTPNLYNPFAHNNLRQKGRARHTFFPNGDCRGAPDIQLPSYEWDVQS